MRKAIDKSALLFYDITGSISNLFYENEGDLHL